MADFPPFVKNETGPPTQAITIEPPEFDDNADHSKTLEESLVEQQWRDVAASGIGGQLPLSINRDAPEVTDDPYTS